MNVSFNDFMGVEFLFNKVSTTFELGMLLTVEIVLTLPFLMIIGLVFFSLLFVVYLLWKKSKKIEKINEVIEIQSTKLKRETRKTQASIEYAKTIQDSFLNREHSIREHFYESSIFLKSKDIVSGDLFYVKEVEGLVIVATIDCSGHGVPGAFMSLIAHQALNKVVESKTPMEPNKILYQMHLEVMNALGRSINSDFSKEGMDISLCIVNKKLMTLDFAGARSSVFIQRGKELHELKGNLVSIGGMYESYINSNEMFDNSSFDLRLGDRLYMFSDGIIDQFGGERGKKLNKQGLKSMILSFNGKSSEMSKYIETFMKEWMNGKNPQIDDMIFLNFEMA